MACYLVVCETESACEGCGLELKPGLIGLTDEITGRFVPQCRRCLFSLDRRLAVVLVCTIAGVPLEVFDQLTAELLERPEILAAFE